MKDGSPQYMKLLLTNSPDIILLFDSGLRLVHCTDAFLDAARVFSLELVKNKAFCEVFSGFAPSEWIERVYKSFLRAVDEKKTVILDETVGERIYRVYFTPMLDDSGVSVGAMALFHDLTDVTRAKEQAERASRAKSDFLTMISHEIRTPINAITGMSDMLKKSELTQKQKELAGNIQASSGILLGLINDVLDFSRLETDKLELVNREFSFREVFDSRQKMFEKRFEEKGLSFAAEYDSGLPETMLADGERIGQILSNLLSNALKYTEKGFVKMKAYADNNMLCIEVSDSGIGIRREDISRLFTAFEHLERVNNKTTAGIGLGLAISHRLCNMMGGDIGVESVYGQGSCFTVRLPISEGGCPAFTAPDARALIVDDIEINLLVASSMVASYGVEVAEALSGAQAVALAQESDFDIIFMDHMMPEMDGVEAAHAIRELGGKNADVPIVALTANVSSEAKKMFFENGFSAFIPKPIDDKVLAACLYKWLPNGKLITQREMSPSSKR